MTKIAVLAPETHPPFIEGIQKNAWAISQEFFAAGHEVVIFSQCSYGEKMESQNIKVNYSLSAGGVRIIKYLRWINEGCRIAKSIKKEGAEILFAFSLDWSFFSPLIWTILLNPKTKIRLICFSKRELGGINKIFLNIIKSRIDKFFPRSQYLKNQLIARGIVSDKIEVVASFPDKANFILTSERPAALKKIAYLSNAEKSAGVDTVISLAQALPEISFTLALRRFSDREESVTKILENKISQKKIPNLSLVRNIDNIVNFYAEQDAIIIPTRSENNSMAAPLVLLEALAMRKIVFLNNLPMFKEYEQKTIMFNDEKELITVIKDLSLHPEKINEKKSSAKDYIDSLPDAQAAAKIYCQ